MSETKLLILKITTGDTRMSKTTKHLDDAIDIMKAKYSAEIIQYEIPLRTFNKVIKDNTTEIDMKRI